MHSYIGRQIILSKEKAVQFWLFRVPEPQDNGYYPAYRRDNGYCPAYRRDNDSTVFHYPAYRRDNGYCPAYRRDNDSTVFHCPGVVKPGTMKNTTVVVSPRAYIRMLLLQPCPQAKENYTALRPHYSTFGVHYPTFGVHYPAFGCLDMWSTAYLRQADAPLWWKNVVF